ncbi:MAG: YigZ family protein, partial [Polyangiaceae bacterium]|nr:YigZ family protein [Polyangiaceae bacterium]
QRVDHVMVVVARHFGGIKLGAGGLVRAYGGTAATCLRLADQQEVVPRVRREIEVPFEHTGELYLLVARMGLTRVGERYTATGLVAVVEVDLDKATVLEESLREATRGRAKVAAVPG